LGKPNYKGPDYGKLESHVLLHAIAERKRHIERLEDVILYDRQQARGSAAIMTHPLEAKIKEERKQLGELENLLALVPLDQLPSHASVSRRVPIRDPNADLEIIPMGVDWAVDTETTALSPFHPQYGSNFSYAQKKAKQLAAEYAPPDTDLVFDLKVDSKGNLEVDDGLEHIKEAVARRLALPEDAWAVSTLAAHSAEDVTLEKMKEAVEKIQPGLSNSPVIEDLFLKPLTLIANGVQPYEEVKNKYDRLRQIAMTYGIPVITSVQLKKDDSTEEDEAVKRTTIIEAGLSAYGYKPLPVNVPKATLVDPRLYYLVEDDGGVVVTGAEISKCTFNTDLPDGSHVAGGLTQKPDGAVTVFGDRTYQENGTTVTRPVRWIDMSEADSLVPPHLRRPPKRPPRGHRSNPSPPLQNIPLVKEDVKLTPTMKKLLDMAQQGLVSKEEAIKSLSIEPLEPPGDEPSPSRFQRIFGKKKGKSWVDEHGRPVQWGDAAKEYQKLRESYDKLLQEQVQLKNLLTATQQQNARLTEKLKKAEEAVATVKHESQVELERIRQRYLGDLNTKRWQIEAIKTDGLTVEGADATIFELEGANENFRYLVVATIPRSTPAEVEKQWMSDLQEKLDARFGIGAVEYFIVPEDMTISVLEVLPGVEDPEDEDDLFQF
jgi:hypothetical protein